MKILEKTYCTANDKYSLLLLPHPLDDSPSTLRERISICIRPCNAIEFKSGCRPCECTCGLGNIVVDTDVCLFGVDTSVKSMVY